ncbi:MAG: hypothetical protein ACFFC6_15085 [Promethearchaeota archaeon]
MRKFKSSNPIILLKSVLALFLVFNIIFSPSYNVYDEINNKLNDNNNDNTLLTENRDKIHKREIPQHIEENKRKPNLKTNKEKGIVNPSISSIQALKNYSVFTPSFYWYDAYSNGIDSGINGDDEYGTLNLPFTFEFFDTSFDTVYVCSNGYLSFSDSSPRRTYSPDTIFPSDDVDAHYVIAPFWYDLTAYNFEGSYIYFWSTTDFVVIEYYDVQYYGTSTVVGSFEVVLFPDGSILFQYQSISDDYGATVGLNYGLNTQYFNSYTLGLGGVSNFALFFSLYIPAPEILEILGGSPQGINRTSYTIKWEATSIEGTVIDHFNVTFDGNFLGNTTTYSWELTNLVEGIHNISVSLALNTSQLFNDSIILIVDLTAPIIEIKAPLTNTIIVNKSDFLVSWNITETLPFVLIFKVELWDLERNTWNLLCITTENHTYIQCKTSGLTTIRVKTTDMGGNTGMDEIDLEASIPTILIVSSHKESIPGELYNLYNDLLFVEFSTGDLKISDLSSKLLVIIPSGGTSDWKDSELRALKWYLLRGGNLIVFGPIYQPKWNEFLASYGINFETGPAYEESIASSYNTSHILFENMQNVTLPSGVGYLDVSGYSKGIASPFNNPNPVIGVFERSEHILAISCPFDSEIEAKNCTYFYENTLLWAQEPRNHYPLVDIISPNGGETLNGSTTIIWTGNDSDGDPITYKIELWNGSDWTLLLDGISNSSILWDTTEVPDGNEIYKIRVTISDRYLEYSDLSDDFFSVQNKPPVKQNVVPEIPPVLIIGAVVGGVIILISFLAYKNFDKIREKFPR